MLRAFPKMLIAVILYNALVFGGGAMNHQAADLLAQNFPVKVVSGRNDKVVPLANAQFLVDRLPNAELAVIDRGHFIWEDAADEYAAHVIAWWDRN